MSEDLTRQLPDDLLRLILASVNTLGDRMTALESRMTTLEEKVERRLQETRPIWEQVLARLDAIEGRLDKLEGRMDRIEGRLDTLEQEMRSGFRALKNKITVLHEDTIEVRAAQLDLEKRVDKLEPESAR